MAVVIKLGTIDGGLAETGLKLTPIPVTKSAFEAQQPAVERF